MSGHAPHPCPNSIGKKKCPGICAGDIKCPACGKCMHLTKPVH